jgi:fungal STAND N-terminal Goodbye domain
MSSTPSPSTSRSNFDSIFNSALQAYKRKTGNDITSHPLANELQSCDSPDAILTVLRRQIPSFDQSQSDHEGFTKYLMPTVNVLYTFSAVLGEGVGLVGIATPSLLRIRGLTFISQVFSPGKVIFAGIGVLLLVRHVFVSLCSPF